MATTLLFDIGANVGRWALDNAQTGTRMVCVEPDPDTFRTLQSNTSKHTLLQCIECLNLAVCAQQGTVPFYKSVHDTLSTLRKEWLTSETSRFFNCGFQETVCNTITLDEMIGRYGVPDLVKIDVESGEFMCLQSLTQKVPLLCFEWAAETREVTDSCLGHLQALGFHEFHIQMGDHYTYRPSSWNDMHAVMRDLDRMVPKRDFGMLWCR